MFKVKLHPFYNIDGDIGDASPSVEGTVETVSTESASVQEGQAPNEAPAESESSFAKRLREHSEKAIKTEREKWEKETSEKYKDYDTHKELSSYFQQINGVDAMTLKERIELERLQERAEQQNVPPEVMKRLDELEAKAAKADELEQQQQQSQQYQEFRANLEKFATEKNANAEELHKYMFDNQIGSMDVAYKAMRADQLEQQLATAKEDSIKEYLASKKGPRVEGSTGAASTQNVDTSKMTWKELDRHAQARLEAARTPQ